MVDIQKEVLVKVIFDSGFQENVIVSKDVAESICMAHKDFVDGPFSNANKIFSFESAHHIAVCNDIYHTESARSINNLDLSKISMVSMSVSEV